MTVQEFRQLLFNVENQKMTIEELRHRLFNTTSLSACYAVQEVNEKIREEILYGGDYDGTRND